MSKSGFQSFGGGSTDGLDKVDMSLGNATDKTSRMCLADILHFIYRLIWVKHSSNPLVSECNTRTTFINVVLYCNDV